MLRQMRENFKSLSWTLWIVIIVFIGGFIIFNQGGLGSKSPGESKTTIISINGEKIRADLFRKKLYRILENYQRQLKNNFNKSIITQLRLPEQILQRIINSKIIEDEAKKLKLRVTNHELKEKIINYPAFQRDGKFIGVKEYENLLAYNRISIKSFEDDLKKEIIAEKLKEIITSGLIIDNETLEKKYKEEKDMAELEFIVLKPDRIKTKIEINENELKQYFNEHKEEFKTLEKRQGAIIVYKYDTFKKDIKISNKELYDYFRKNKKMFLTPEKTKVSRIFIKYNKQNREEKLKYAEELSEKLNKENFSKKAKEFSQDDKAENGGDWGLWQWKNFTTQELSVIERLKANQISSPIDTLTGFSIIYISENVPENQQTFETAKKRIKDIIEREKLTNFVNDKLGKIYAKLKNKTNIKDKARELGIKIIETEALSNGQSIKNLDEVGYISRKLFTLNKNETTFPVELIKGIAIVQLSKIIEPEFEKFENIKKKVQEKITHIKKMNLLIENAKKISNTLNNPNMKENLKEKFIKENNLSSNNFTYKRGNKLSFLPQKNKLDDFIFSLDLDKYSKPIEYQSEVVILKIKNIKITSKYDFENDKTEFYTKKKKELKNNFFTTYILNKREDYKISFNQELYTEVKDQVLSKFK
jgi:peptidyl-prolyl cis-trans isomerase D